MNRTQQAYCTAVATLRHVVSVTMTLHTATMTVIGTALQANLITLTKGGHLRIASPENIGGKHLPIGEAIGLPKGHGSEGLVNGAALFAYAAYLSSVPGSHKGTADAWDGLVERYKFTGQWADLPKRLRTYITGNTHNVTAFRKALLPKESSGGGFRAPRTCEGQVSSVAAIASTNTIDDPTDDNLVSLRRAIDLLIDRADMWETMIRAEQTTTNVA